MLHGRVYAVISATRSVTCRYAARRPWSRRALGMQRLSDYCVDLGGIKGALRMID
jgi:hypothetical protein